MKNLVTNMGGKVILMILNQKFLPDIRVEQEYMVLREAGYRVIVIADENGEDNAAYEIIRINSYRHKANWYTMTLSVNPVLKYKVINELKKRGIENIDVVHVHDLLWSFLGLQIARHYKSKFLIDLHENYPEMVRDNPNDYKKVESPKTLRQRFKILVNNLKHPLPTIFKIASQRAYSVTRLYAYENKMLEKCDRFIVVVDEALDRLKQKKYYGKGIIVSNTKDPDLWKFEKVPELNEKLVVSYVGTIHEIRGLDTAILAMKYLNQADFELNIVGTRKDSPAQKYFLKLIEDNNITNVNLVEWIENEEDVISFIKSSHVCIVPHKNTGLTQTTVPHKLFMYMAIGRPVLVSDVAPLRRIVSESNNGFIFIAEDPIDLSEKLKKMRDPDLLEELAKNGRYAAENNYNWANDKARLLNLYSELLC